MKAKSIKKIRWLALISCRILKAPLNLSWSPADPINLWPKPLNYIKWVAKFTTDVTLRKMTLLSRMGACAARPPLILRTGRVKFIIRVDPLSQNTNSPIMKSWAWTAMTFRKSRARKRMIRILRSKKGSSTLIPMMKLKCNNSLEVIVHIIS